MIYLDYTATTPIDGEVLDVYAETQKKHFANINSLHKLGQESFILFEKAKADIRNTLNFKHKLVFTGSASEANNFAILGIARKYPSGTIITTDIEHPSVYEVCGQLENEGYVVKYLHAGRNGIIDVKELESYLGKETILVSVMWVNNVIGSIQPIADIKRLISKYPKAKFHVDGVQGLCKTEPAFDFNDIDLLTFSAHKIYGPKGIGLLAVKDNVDLKKVVYGGNGQYGIKPGTVDLAGVTAFCKSITKYYPTTKDRFHYVRSLNKALREKINDIPGALINSDPYCSPYIMSVSFLGIQGETIVNMLSSDDIYVATGSACSQKLKKPDRTVFNVSGSKDIASSAIRISLSAATTFAELDELCASLRKVRTLCMM